MSVDGGGGGGSNKVEETELERAMGRIAIEQWNDYQTRFMPLENRLIGEVRTTQGETDQATGWANAASEQQFSQARSGLRDNLFQGGLNPASGGFASRMAGLATDEALATGMSQVDSGQAMEDQEVYGLQGAVELGRGNSTSALQQFGRSANAAQDQAISDARIALNERLGTQRAVGTALGAATAYGLQKPTPGSANAGLNTNGMAGLSSSQAWRDSGMKYSL